MTRKRAPRKPTLAERQAARSQRRRQDAEAVYRQLALSPSLEAAITAIDHALLMAWLGGSNEALILMSRKPSGATQRTRRGRHPTRSTVKP